MDSGEPKKSVYAITNGPDRLGIALALLVPQITTFDFIRKENQGIPHSSAEHIRFEVRSLSRSHACVQVLTFTAYLRWAAGLYLYCVAVQGEYNLANRTGAFSFFDVDIEKTEDVI